MDKVIFKIYRDDKSRGKDAWINFTRYLWDEHRDLGRGFPAGRHRTGMNLLEYLVKRTSELKKFNCTFVGDSEYNYKSNPKKNNDSYLEFETEQDLISFLLKWS